MQLYTKRICDILTAFPIGTLLQILGKLPCSMQYQRFRKCSMLPFCLCILKVKRIDMVRRRPGVIIGISLISAVLYIDVYKRQDKAFKVVCKMALIGKPAIQRKLTDCFTLFQQTLCFCDPNGLQITIWRNTNLSGEQTRCV